MAVFISYSQKDKVFVDRLCNNLVAEKIHLWMDRWELRPGDLLIDSIQTALKQAGAVLIILSKNYVESSWCKKEMNSALIRELEEKGNIIIPVVTDDCEIPLFLREKLYANFKSDWDEAYRFLAEALSRFTNLDQGRIDTPQFHVDYSNECIVSNEEVVGLRYQFVEHAEKRPFSVLTIINIIFNEKLQRRYMEYVKAGLEEAGRTIVSKILIEYLENNELKVELKDASPIKQDIEIADNKNGLSLFLSLEVRWMGEDTGKTVIYWSGESLKGALLDFLSKVRKFTPEESLEMLKIIRKPIN